MECSLFLAYLELFAENQFRLKGRSLLAGHSLQLIRLKKFWKSALK